MDCNSGTLSINVKCLTVKYPVLHKHSSLHYRNTLKYSQGITQLPPKPPNWAPHFYSLPLPINPFTKYQNDLFKCRFVQVCASPSPTLKILQWLSSAWTIKCKLLFMRNQPQLDLLLSSYQRVWQWANQYLCRSSFLCWTTHLLPSPHLAVC